MKKLNHILFLSCLKATELIEKKFHFKLSFTERLQLKIHKMMCDACRQYENHSLIIEKGIASSLKEEHPVPDLELIKKFIREKLAETEG